MADERRCAACRALVLVGAAFCAECGTRVPATAAAVDGPRRRWFARPLPIAGALVAFLFLAAVVFGGGSDRDLPPEIRQLLAALASDDPAVAQDSLSTATRELLEDDEPLLESGAVLRGWEGSWDEVSSEVGSVCADVVIDGDVVASYLLILAFEDESWKLSSTLELPDDDAEAAGYCEPESALGG